MNQKEISGFLWLIELYKKVYVCFCGSGESIIKIKKVSLNWKITYAFSSVKDNRNILFYSNFKNIHSFLIYLTNKK